MALNLFEPMRVAHLTNSHLQWSYYFSGRGDFLVVYPFASGPDFMRALHTPTFDEYLGAMYAYDASGMATPARNPKAAQLLDAGLSRRWWGRVDGQQCRPGLCRRWFRGHGGHRHPARLPRWGAQPATSTAWPGMDRRRSRRSPGGIARQHRQHVADAGGRLGCADRRPSPRRSAGARPDEPAPPKRRRPSCHGVQPLADNSEHAGARLGRAQLAAGRSADFGPGTSGAPLQDGAGRLGHDRLLGLPSPRGGRTEPRARRRLGSGRCPAACSRPCPTARAWRAGRGSPWPPR